MAKKEETLGQKVVDFFRVKPDEVGAKPEVKTEEAKVKSDKQTASKPADLAKDKTKPADTKKEEAKDIEKEVSKISKEIEGKMAQASKKSVAEIEKEILETRAKNDTAKIPAGSDIKGNMTFKSNLDIEGNIEGDVTCEGDIYIRNGAVVTGNISAKKLHVLSGKITGNIKVKDLDLNKDSETEGLIEADRATIGAKVVGNIKVKDDLSIISEARINGDIEAGSISIMKGAKLVSKVSIGVVEDKAKADKPVEKK